MPCHGNIYFSKWKQHHSSVVPDLNCNGMLVFNIQYLCQSVILKIVIDAKPHSQVIMTPTTLGKIGRTMKNKAHIIVTWLIDETDLRL